MRECVIDVEANGLWDDLLDFSSLPYKLKPEARVHCVVLQDINTQEVFVLYNDHLNRTPDQISRAVGAFGDLPNRVVYLPMEKLPTVLNRCSRLIAHNGLGYDFPLLSLWGKQPYEVGPKGLAFPHKKWPSREKHRYDTWNGNKVNLDDTLLMSQLLNPDRFGGHSLEEWGVRLGSHKVDVVEYTYENLQLYMPGGKVEAYRAEVDKLGKTQKAKQLKTLYFSKFTPHMVFYCIQDTLLCTKTYFRLKNEWGTHYWNEAYNIECMVADIIFRQSLLGFKFDKEHAKWAYKDLTDKMGGIERKVNPLLPKRGLTKGEEALYTPPKQQVKQDRTMSSNMEKWLTSHGGRVGEVITEEVGKRVKKTLEIPLTVHLYGKEWKFPLEPDTPVIDGVPMSLKDHTDLKEYIVSLGWAPTEWGLSDITSVSGKKVKKELDSYEKAIKDYLNKKVNSPFLPHILEQLDLESYEQLVELLENHKQERPLKLPTSPKYTVGQEKELCPNLVALGEKVEFIQDVVKWLTYNHRRNAIFSKAEDSATKTEDTGWLTNPRLDIDGRIPTPARTNSCNTGRMQHINVANVARVSSLYGEHMRRLFGVDTRWDYQIGYDADGLEARTEGHYCYQFDGVDKQYIHSLTAPKPNDLHTINATLMNVSRDTAKSGKYAMTYGCTVKRLAKTLGVPLEEAERIFNAFWEASKPLERLKADIERQWKTKWNKQYVEGIDGRKIMTRSKHSLLNSLFQSCGVIAMKIAMIWADKELKKKNLVGDIFKENIYSRPTTNQMIAYHDEAQNRVSKELVKCRVFDSEEKAKAFKASYKGSDILSDVIHNGDNFIVARSEVGHILAKSVNVAGKFLSLNVPLTAAWMLGRNWAECH